MNAGGNFSTDVIAKEITITIPGATNAFSPKQIVYVNSRIELQASMSTSVVGCPCVFGATIEDVTTATFSPTASVMFESSSNAYYPYAWTVNTVFVVPPGERTFRVSVNLGDRATDTNAAYFDIVSNSTLTAMTFPFGAGGTNELAP
ncbi:MAG: hypothetical protein ABIP53_03595 [Candidatus Limnocylindrales bacterium]